MDVQDFEKTLQGVTEKVRRNAVRFGERFPPDVTAHLDYSAGLGGNVGWTTGFWLGQLWLTYQLTRWDQIRDLARSLGPTFDERLAAGVGVDHDLGMLFLPSRVLEYRLTGDEQSRAGALRAASALASRFRQPGQFIQAWGAPDDPQEAGRTIIDSMMNIPLLFWAHGETGDRLLYDRAMRHALTVGRYLVRGDGSSYHTFFFDVASGQPVGGRTHQGHSDGSTWARGQAWGLYGFALAYRLSGEARFLRHSQQLAGYFLSHLPEDGVCYWDLDRSDPEEPRDTSAAAIAACGLMELAAHVGGGLAKDYRGAARMMVCRLAERYRAPDEKEGLLAEAVADLPRGRGVRESTLYGDYFFLEALVRLLGKDVRLPWLF
ncbi:MAG: glycoside hydrolase family 88 protein [Bacillota bacterium]